MVDYQMSRVSGVGIDIRFERGSPQLLDFTIVVVVQYVSWESNPRKSHFLFIADCGDIPWPYHSNKTPQGSRLFVRLQQRAI